MGMLASAATVRKRVRAGTATGVSAMASEYYGRMLRAVALALILAAPQFQPALPGYDFSFPRDHGAHGEYKTEWWYYTGHLETDDGKRYGFELTFFRVGVVPPGDAAKTRWDLRSLSLAHFAITDVAANEFRYYEKLNRTSPFTAGAAAG